MSCPDIDSAVTSYGAPFADSRPVEDATTDMAAAQANAVFVSTAAMTHTSVRTVVKFTGVTWGGGTQSVAVTSHDAHWGNANAVIPVITTTATGIYNITWPTTVADELGTIHTVNLRYALSPSVDVASDATKVGATGNVTLTGANTATLRTCAVAGTLSALNGLPITVYVV